MEINHDLLKRKREINIVWSGVFTRLLRLIMWTSLVSTADQVEGCMHHEPCSVWPACTTTSTGGGGGGVPWVNQGL
jgi:hypothetical protein